MGQYGAPGSIVDKVDKAFAADAARTLDDLKTIAQRAISITAPDIDIDPDKLSALALTMANYRNVEGTDFGLRATEMLEEGIIGVIGNTNIDKVSETLQLILQGADGMFAGIQNQTNESSQAQQEKKREKEAETARTILEATAPSIEIDPIVLGGFMAALDDNWTEKDQSDLDKANDAINSAIESSRVGNGINTADQRQFKTAFDDLDQRAHEILLNDPKANPENGEKYSEMSEEEQKGYRERVFIEKLIKNEADRARDAGEEPNFTTLEEAESIIQAMLKNEPENLLKLASQTTKSYSATSASELVIANTTKAIALSDEMKDKTVVSFQYEVAGTTDYMEVYEGTSLSEDGKSLINDSDAETKYYTALADGRFMEIPLEYAIISSPEKGAELAKQITDSGLKFDDLNADTKQFLAEDINVHSMADLINHLNTEETSMGAVSILMGNETFVQTVGSYALRTGIEAEIADGQIFANDPRLAELIDSDDLIAQQEENIQALNEQIASLKLDLENTTLRPFFEPQIAELEQQAKDAQEQLDEYKKAVAELENAEENLDTITQEHAEAKAETDALYSGGMSTAPHLSSNEPSPLDKFTNPDLTRSTGNFSTPADATNMTSFNPRTLAIKHAEFRENILEIEQGDAAAAVASASAAKDKLASEMLGEETKIDSLGMAPDVAQLFFDNNKAEIYALMTEAHPEGLNPETLKAALKSMGASISDAELDRVVKMVDESPDMKVLAENGSAKQQLSSTFDPNLTINAGMS